MQNERSEASVTRKVLSKGKLWLSCAIEEKNLFPIKCYEEENASSGVSSYSH